MKKRSTLLKVMSIILLVIGCLGIISSIGTLLMKDMIKTTYEAMGVPAPTAVSDALGWISAIVLLAAGIIGLMYKSKQSVLIIGIILLLSYVASFVYGIMIVGFSALSLVSFIFPLLYLWGWYQSN